MTTAMDNLEVLFRGITNGITTESLPIKFYKEFMATFPPLEAETPPPGAEHDAQFWAHWQSYQYASNIMVNVTPQNKNAAELFYSHQKSVLEEYTIAHIRDRALVHFYFAVNAERRLLAMNVKRFYEFVNTNPYETLQTLERIRDSIVVVKRRLETTKRVYELQLKNDESQISCESTEDDEEPCQGCGSGVPVGDEGEYRPGFWCCRGCAYDDLRDYT
jgi:hypothetical protein